MTIFLFFLVLSILVFYYPNFLGHSDNYIPANPMQTPASIVPEWYLLPFYAILRSIPNKLLGVLAMFGALLIFLILPYSDLSRIRGASFRPLMKFIFWLFVTDFIILMWIGSQHPETPYVEIGQVATAFYFLWFIFLVPVAGILENTLFDLATISNNKNDSPLPTSNNYNKFKTFVKPSLINLTKTYSVDYLKVINRQFSTKSNGYVATDLHEWLRGFTDAEGCFMIIYYKTTPFTFRLIFKFKLHRDDRPLLEYLKHNIIWVEFILLSPNN